VLVLLPPSEGKTAPTSGAPLDLSSLSLGGLTDARAEVLASLADLSARADALELLKAPASAADEVEAQRDIHGLPAARADEIFTGVLFDRAGLASMSDEAKARAEAEVLVMSAAFRALSLSDRIPAYRLGASASLPGLPTIGAYWRPHLSRELDARVEGELVVDCRSGGYRSMWKVPPTAELVSVGAVTVRDGKRSVVSHDAKYFRGLLVGHLMRRPAASPTSGASLVEAAHELVGSVRYAAVPGRGGKPRTTWTLTGVTMEPAPRPGGAKELTLVLTQEP
jgi:cytoplasmic iron level regulating protein YaaA (DUF328/UPF0246 family)